MLTEGVLVWDDGTFARLSLRPFALKSDFSADISEQLGRLKLFRDLHAFGDFLCTCIRSSLHNLQERGVLRPSREMGCPQFNKRKAFREFYRLRPDLIRLRSPLAALERYYTVSVRSPVNRLQPSAGRVAARFSRSLHTLEGNSVRRFNDQASLLTASAEAC